MTLFAVHDATGMLTQANKVYAPEGYGKLLDDAGLTHVAIDTNTLPSFKDWYVNVSAKELIERPIMPIEVNKTAIKAGGIDSALITGIPKNAKVVVAAVNAVLHTIDPLDATELEIAIPVPCIYRITISVWPFKDQTISIEAM